MFSTNIYLDTISKLSIESKGKTKYLKWYSSIITRGLNRTLSTYTESHHIVPECFFKHRTRKGVSGFLEGNCDDKLNLVSLTPEEHLTAHLILIKMFSTSFKKYHALVKGADYMCTHSQNVERLNNKRYGWLKRQISQQMSLNCSGENNHNHKKRWITNDTEEQFIPQYQSIPDGWRLGRLKSNRPPSQKGHFGNHQRINKTQEEYHKIFSENASKEWSVIDPNGIIYHIHNLTEFCINNSLVYGLALRSARTKTPTTKGRNAGWQFSRI